jgi:hypothetical protein
MATMLVTTREMSAAWPTGVSGRHLLDIILARLVLPAGWVQSEEAMAIFWIVASHTGGHWERTSVAMNVPSRAGSLLSSNWHSGVHERRGEHQAVDEVAGNGIRLGIGPDH